MLLGIGARDLLSGALASSSPCKGGSWLALIHGEGMNLATKEAVGGLEVDETAHPSGLASLIGLAFCDC